MKRWLAVLAALLVICAIFLILRPDKVGKGERIILPEGGAEVLFLAGEVKVRGQRFTEWIDVAPGLELSAGDSVRTGGASWVEIDFAKGLEAAVKVGENTLAEIIDTGPVDIGLLKGELRSLVERLDEDSDFRVRTPTAVCGVRGTGWDTATDGAETVVDIYENKVFFSRVFEDGGAIESAILVSGDRGIVKDRDSFIIITDQPARGMDDWNGWKKDFIERRRVRKGLSPPKKINRGKDGKGPKVWVEEESDGDYRLMIREEEERR